MNAECRILHFIAMLSRRTHRFSAFREKTHLPPEFLIIGLGNPGREYRHNRHNVGFMALERLASRLGARFRRKQSSALVTDARLGEQRLLLAKPQTYMNLSGGSVASLIRFYHLPLDHLLVCYDELDLPVGALRLRAEGGSAGHNGIQSIIQSIGSQEFPRLRLGIGRAPGRKAGAAHVLQDFKGEEAGIMDLTLDRAVDAIETFVNEGIIPAMNRFNSLTPDH